MEHEIEYQLSNIESLISAEKAKCRKTIFETLNLLKKNYPEHQTEIQMKFDEICKKYGIDFFAEIIIDAKDINEYLENNVNIINS